MSTDSVYHYISIGKPYVAGRLNQLTFLDTTVKMPQLLFFLFFVFSLVLGQPNLETTSRLESDSIEEQRSSNSDLVTKLPGLTFTPKFKQYSGYLDGLDGRKLHYFFVESERSPKSDPVVLWMNGGPGCSSLTALFTEQGPYRVNKSNPTVVTLNPHRWNRVANVIFLESPAGVGFSYREGKSGRNLTTGDDEVADNNVKAIESFFQKFPHLKSNSFYVTGESYGGIYVPTLSVRLLKSKSVTNFVGYAIGNGMLDYEKNYDSLVLFGYTHGLIGQSMWSKLVSTCCRLKGNGLVSDPLVIRQGCRFSGSKDQTCQQITSQAINSIYRPNLNIYNMFSKCEHPDGGENVALLQTGAFGRRSSNQYQLTRRFFLDNLISRLKEGIDTITFRESDSDKEKSNSPCIDDSHVQRYLNQRVVREALHIPNQVKAWEMCSEEIFKTYRRQYFSMRSQILELVRAGKKGLIFNGDVDLACNALGDSWFVDDLGLPLTKEYKEWSVGGQIAGYSKEFKNLKFLTVKGSGHMVPTDKPEEAFALFEDFIKLGK